MRAKIRLDTITEARDFVDIVSHFSTKVLIKDGNGMCVNGKSLLGALHAMEFSDIWCESEEDIYTSIKQFVII